MRDVKDLVNVFTGPDAIADFLRPDNSRPTPLVEMTEYLGVGLPDNVRIFGKLMTHTQLNNVKHYPAWVMLEDAQAKRQLDHVTTVVEASSGGLAYSLGFIARYFGIPHVVAIVPADIAPGKLEMLRFANVFPWLHAETPGNSCIDVARQMGQIESCVNLNQYSSVSNRRAHCDFTAEQVWEQTQGKVSVFVAGMGTTATIGGAYDCFLSKETPVAVVGAVLAPGAAVPGIRTEERLRQVGFDYHTGIIHIAVEQKESYEYALEVSRLGIPVGPSSGSAMAAAIRFVKETPNETITNQYGEVVVVVALGDLPHFYFEKFTMALGSDHFPSLPESIQKRLAGVK